MATQKLIVILGATGNQGGSVVNSFLDDPQWKVRGLTRNASSGKARDLTRRGVEVIEADLGDPTSLGKAFQGAYAIFVVSDFWGLYFDPANAKKPGQGEPLNLWAARAEKQQLVNAIDAAAKVTGLERLVLSSLSNGSKWSKGTYTHIYHFDYKAQAVDYAAKAHPQLWAKTSVFQAGCFLSNYSAKSFMSPVQKADGLVEFIGNVRADTKLPMIAVEEDSGPLVKALVEESPGKNLIAYREWITPAELASFFTAATGLAAEVVTLPKGQARGAVPDDLKIEMDDNWAYWNEFGYEGRDDPTVIHPDGLEHPPKLGSVFEWLQKQDWKGVFGCAAAP